MALCVAPLALLLFTTTLASATAAEALPGESCADVAAGAFRQSSGPEVPGAGHILVCDGANWQPVLSYNDDGEITMIGNQACGSGDVLTYNSAIWTCGAGGGGSSLWEEVGGVLRPTSATPRVTLNSSASASGDYSVAWGMVSRAESYNSTAWGAYTSATGDYSTAFGFESRALGEGSVAWGLGDTDGDSFPPTASGDGSTAWGAVTLAGGYLSTVWGSHNYANEDYSTVWGNRNSANGVGSTAWGYYTVADGLGSTAWGLNAHAGSYGETSLGRYPLNTAGNATSWVATDTLFEIGNGTNNANRSNAVTVYKNGRTELNIANDTGGCTAAKTGRLRYDDVNDKWEYCSGSDPWLPFEQAGSAGLSGPADCPEIGEACDDDTIFAGWNPVTHERLFIPPADQGQLAWRSAGAGSDTGAVDIADGRINQQWIEANRTIANYPAFKACADLNAANHLGHNDWYLPSRGEVYYLWLVRTQLESKAETIFQNANYWSSTENNATLAWYQNFPHGSQSLNDKTHGTIWVRCVRR